MGQGFQPFAYTPGFEPRSGSPRVAGGFNPRFCETNAPNHSVVVPCSLRPVRSPAPIGQPRCGWTLLFGAYPGSFDPGLLVENRSAVQGRRMFLRGFAFYGRPLQPLMEQGFGPHFAMPFPDGIGLKASLQRVTARPPGRASDLGEVSVPAHCFKRFLTACCINADHALRHARLAAIRLLRHSSAYRPLVAVSSSWVPFSTMRPWLRT